MSSYEELLGRLLEREIRFVVVGVSAANYYAASGGTVFATQDRDLLLPPESSALLGAWRAAGEAGFALWVGAEPLGEPVDLDLASRVIRHRARTEAVHPGGEQVDFMLQISGHDFEALWQGRRTFRVGSLDVPVARLRHVIESKAATGRAKDRLFLETYREALEELLEEERDG